MSKKELIQKIYDSSVLWLVKTKKVKEIIEGEKNKTSRNKWKYIIISVWISNSKEIVLVWSESKIKAIMKFVELWWFKTKNSRKCEYAYIDYNTYQKHKRRWTQVFV